MNQSIRSGLDRPRLLLIEDDQVLAPLLEELLRQDYRVDTAGDGQRGLHLALTREYDAMVIDRGLPAIEGVDLVQRLRSRGIATPILLLTARGTLTERVEGLDAGAEDYLVKPFEIDELLARIRAMLRRHPDTSAVLSLGSRSLRIDSRTVVGADAEPVELSKSESELLATLARRPDKLFTRPELLAAVFDPADGSGTVDTYVYYLRRKLGRRVIRTVYGVGYQLGTL